MKGNIRRSKTIQLAYFDQMRETLDPNLKAMDFVSGGKTILTLMEKVNMSLAILDNFYLLENKQWLQSKCFLEVRKID